MEGLKHSGISQVELCELVLHLLRLATATVTIEPVESDSSESTNRIQQKKVTIHYENVGYIHGHDSDPVPWQDADTQAELDEILDRPFALPSPARDALMSIAASILSKKSLLRAVSNAAIFPKTAATTTTAYEDGTSSRLLMILHWKAMFRLLLKTAPYLDEHKWGELSIDSNSRQSSSLKRTVQLVRQCRRFFDQGIQHHQDKDKDKDKDKDSPNDSTDKTAREIWMMLRTDMLHQHHTHACYRALVLMDLLQPTRCTPAFYAEVLPQWVESWTRLDRCAEIDFLWMVLFCRARKHLPEDQYDWTFLRKRLLTLSQYW